MMVGKSYDSVFLGVDHLVFLTRDIKASIINWERMLSLHTRVEHTEHGVAQAFFTLPDGAFIELVAPTDDDSSVAQLIEEKGEGFYVLAMRVTNMLDAQAFLKANGAMLRGEGTDRVFVVPEAISEPTIQLWPIDRPHRWRDAKTKREKY